MEVRLARLEEKSDHIQSDLKDLKTDVGRIEAKIDSNVFPKIDALKDSIVALEGRMRDSMAALEARLDARMAKLDMRIARLDVGRWVDRVWSLLIGAAILGVLARGFKWI